MHPARVRFIEPITPGCARVASIEELIAMKRVAGRAKDFEDIAALEALRADDDDTGP